MEYNQPLELAAELGCRLMCSGAEIYRVEESMGRLLKAYGLDGAEVFAIPSCVIVSASREDGQSVTRLRRIPAHGTDIELLERCNALCRRLCAETPPPKQALGMIYAVGDDLPGYHPEQILLGYGLAPAFFAPLFGGGVKDALSALTGGIAVGVCLLYGQPLTGSNTFFRTAVCSAAASLLSLLLVRIGLGQRVDVITISVLMMLVPGMALTNAMREIMAGDTISGLTHITDALLTAGAIALGAAAGLYIGRMLS